MTDAILNVPTMAEMTAKGKVPEILFWVGCAGSYDERYKKVTKSFVKILNKLEISFAVLGTEETCSGDPARRAGNEFFASEAASTLPLNSSTKALVPNLSTTRPIRGFPR